MIPVNYRVDPVTGAVLFHNSAGRKKSQQREQKIQELQNKIEKLESFNSLLLSNLEGILSDEQIKSLKMLM